MAKASPAITAFNSGIVSSLFDGRTDIDTYSSSCTELTNFIPTVQGPIVKRAGSIYVAGTKNNSKVRLIPFQFSVEQAYILEFGDSYIRFYSNNEQIESGGVPVEISSPYAEADLFDIQYAQTADLMYLTHPDHAPRKLSRTAVDTFSLDVIEFDWPAFLEENLDDNSTVSISPTSGTDAGDNVTITSSQPIFSSDMADSVNSPTYFKLSSVLAAVDDEWKASTAYSIGDYVYFERNLYVARTSGTSGVRPPVHLNGTEKDGSAGVSWEFVNTDGAGYLLITGFTSTTEVDATVVVGYSSSIVTNNSRWAFSAWSPVEGYPRAVAFYENRLIFAGTNGKPQTIWGSVSDVYEDFFSGTEDDESFVYTINTNQVNTIQWLAPSKVLAIGTAGGEFIATGSTFNQAITPTNVRITRQTAFGSAHIQPVQIGADVLFCQRSLRGIREYRYNFEIEGYVATDLNVFADEILNGDVVAMTSQQEPNRVIWFTMADGGIVTLSFDRQQSVVAWGRHSIGGNGIVESIEVIPHPDGDVDQVWMSVKRTIDGNTVRYIERLDKISTGSIDVNSGVHSDSAVIYSGAATDTITGLDHLEGETVQILCDGAVLKPDQVVSSGQITLPSECSNVVVGFNYESQLQTLRLDAGSEDGTSQGKTGRVHNLTVRVRNSGAGMFYGYDFDNMAEAPFRVTTDLMDNPVPLKTGDIGPLAMPRGYEKPLKLAIKHILPLPFTLVALYPQLHKQDR